MTTIVAVKKRNKICLAADSLALFGTRKELSGRDVADGNKIIQIGPNAIAMAGHVSWGLILKDYFFKENVVTEWESSDQIHEIFHTFHLSLKRQYFFSPTYSSYEPFESSDLELLITNSYGIFEVDYLRTVREYKYFSAIGTGEEYALGAIQAVYQSIDDVKNIATIGLEAASEFDRKTAPPFESYSIDLKRST